MCDRWRRHRREASPLALKTGGGGREGGPGAQARGHLPELQRQGRPSACGPHVREVPLVSAANGAGVPGFAFPSLGKRGEAPCPGGTPGRLGPCPGPCGGLPGAPRRDGRSHTETPGGDGAGPGLGAPVAACGGAGDDLAQGAP